MFVSWQEEADVVTRVKVQVGFTVDRAVLRVYAADGSGISVFLGPNDAVTAQVARELADGFNQIADAATRRLVESLQRQIDSGKHEAPWWQREGTQG